MKDKKEKRKQRFAEMEQKLKEIYPREEDRMFYYHSSEDRIVLSHAIFWVMTLPQFLKGKIRKEKYFLLLRQYEEEMMDAFLMEDDYFSDLLRYCNIQYEYMPIVMSGVHDMRKDKDARKLAAIAVVAAGYAGDMPEELCNELLDDIDFYNNRVKSRKIEELMPQLQEFVEKEMKR